ncbi:MAG: ATP-binding protein [Candidatus Diapherotrites archaeon]
MVSFDNWVSAIKDFHSKELPFIVPRDYFFDLNLPLRRAYSVIGPRRAGKTFELFQIIKSLKDQGLMKQCIYANFEKPGFEFLSAKDLEEMMNAFYFLYPENKNKQAWLFLDEIQNVNGWELFVREQLDEGLKVFISGSSSRMLSSEVATSMRGRTLPKTIFPFSFKEYLRAKGISLQKGLSSSEKALVLNHFSDYFNYGGYPEAVIYPAERENILTEIGKTVVLRDVVERKKIKNPEALNRLVEGLFHSKEFSVNKFYKHLKYLGVKTSKDSLYAYLGYLNEAFFAFTLKKFSFSLKKSEQSTPKIYFIDNGLLRIRGIHDKGRLLENAVFIELLRRGKELAYYRTDSGTLETDFIVKKDNHVTEIIQACYDLSEPETKKRELKALLNAGKEFNCKKLSIITFDYTAEETHKFEKTKFKIKFIPLWKWLLENKKA